MMNTAPRLNSTEQILARNAKAVGLPVQDNTGIASPSIKQLDGA